MLDIKLIRKDRAKIEKGLIAKEGSCDLSALLKLDEQIRAHKQEVEQLKSKRNEYSKRIGELKRTGQDAKELMDEVASFSARTHVLDGDLMELEKKFTEELAKLPNVPFDDVPVAQDPADNVCIHTSGEKPKFDFPSKNHLELNEKLGLFDFVRGAKISGTGWAAYRGMGARLEWALINYMLDIHLKNGYEQWIPPLCVRPEVVFGSGQLPKFEEQQFKIHDKDYHLYLIPTSEVPLTGLHMGEILTEDELPLKYVSYTPCFRREAGAAGKQERGLIRMHQFNKVEMYCLTKPEDSGHIFDQMLASAEQVLKGLDMHYRSMLLVTGDMSYCAAKTVDVEVWLPGQNRYYEVSSVSNCTAYQSRRADIRFRRKDGSIDHVHTLNGSGLATSRLMVAILENNQNADGTVTIPPVLRKYLDGQEKLVPKPA